MTEPTRMTDAELLSWLGEIAATIDPPDPDAYTSGHDAFLLRRLDEELAELVADSRLDAQAVRGDVAAIRLLSFQARGLTVDIQVTDNGPTRTALGQVAREHGGLSGRIVVESPAGEHSAAAIDDAGRFELTDLPDALVRLRIEMAGGPSVATTWFGL